MKASGLANPPPQSIIERLLGYYYQVLDASLEQTFNAQCTFSVCCLQLRPFTHETDLFILLV